MIEFFRLLLIVVGVTQLVAFGVAIYSRLRPKDLNPVLLRGVAPDKAAGIVGAFVESVSDDRFGFPTGHFGFNEAESTPQRLVMDERNFEGSEAFGLAKSVVLWPFRAGGCLGSVIFLFVLGFTLYLAIPLLMLAVTEVALRHLLKSRIEAELKPLEDEPGTSVHLRLRGISALSVERRLTAAFRTPELPARYRQAPTAISST